MRKFLLSLLFILCLASPCLATNYYVDKTGSDSNLCTNWGAGNACLTIMGAQGKASNGDTINVDDGTYVEDEATLHCLAVTKQLTFLSRNGRSSTTIQGNASGTRVVDIVAGGSSSSFNGFTFDGTGKSQCFRMNANVTTITVTSCAINGASTAALYTTGTGIADINITLTNITGDANTVTLIYAQGDAKGFRINQCVLTHTAAAAAQLFKVDGSLAAGTTYSGFILNANTIYHTPAANCSGALHLNPSTTGDVTITGNTWTQGANTKTASWFLQHTALSAVTITGNTIDFSAVTTVTISAVLGNLIDMGRSYTVAATSTNISNNTITIADTPNGDDVISLTNQPSITIDGNTITHTGTGGTTGIRIVPGANITSPSVTNNTIYTKTTGQPGVSDGYGIQIGKETTDANDTHLDGATITGNKLFGPFYYTPTSSLTTTLIHGIMYGMNKNATISKNLVWGFGYGLVLKERGLTWTAGGVFYNIFINNLAEACIILKSAISVKVWNNTIYNDPQYAQSADGIKIIRNGDGTEEGNNASVQNNLIHLRGGCHHIFTDSHGVPATLDYNLYWSSTPTGFSASGGTESDSSDGLYHIHKFTTLGANTLTVSAGSSVVDILVVAGGGAGGGTYGAGGGAGGMRTWDSDWSTPPAISANQTVTIGDGGTGGTGVGNTGADTSVGTIITAKGGGGGGSGITGGANGGSGGGGAATTTTAGTATPAGQGNNGGAGRSASTAACGGGGGRGAVGTAATNAQGGAGGAGLASTFSGTSVTYSGGGGGDSYITGSAGGGGTGGGGGGNMSGVGTAGTSNTGGGGGGGSSNGGKGGSGVAVIRYAKPGTSGLAKAYINDVQYDNWAGIQGSYEAHGKNSNSFFVGAPYNLRVKGQSQAFHNGTTVWSGTANVTDYAGVPITDGSGTVLGTTSIGAFQNRRSGFLLY